MQRAASALDLGRTAMEAGQWERARGILEPVVGEDPNGPALEALGTAYFWLDHPDTIEVRERGYRWYRAAGDRLGAARLAIALARDHVTFRGEAAVAQGWLVLAARSLDGMPLVTEHGHLALWEADFAIGAENPIEAERHAARAREIGIQLAAGDIELLARAQLGYILVSRGRIAEGMRMLDAAAAAAAAGEIVDPALAGYSYCYVLTASSTVLDLPRAAAWCTKLSGHCQRVGFHSMQHICRVEYAGVLLERGQWGQAETEILEAAAGLQARRPGLAGEATARLGELRRRQGRIEEARALFAQVEGHPRVVVGQAAILLDAGDETTAAAMLERHLRQIPASSLVAHIPALALLIRAKARLGAVQAARDALASLTSCTGDAGSGPLRAIRLVGEAEVRLAENAVDAARAAAEDAIDLCERAGTAFSAAGARAVLVRILLAAGDAPGAAREAERAGLEFERLGAVGDAEMVRGLLAGAAAGAALLTPRELEVLGLIAQGLSNADVARRLVLSEHTVHRHMANMLTKLGAPTRAAAVARAASLGLLPPAP